MAHMDTPGLCCYQAVWPPEPVEHTVTAVETLPSPLTVFTGAIDGGIIKWKPVSDDEGATGPGSLWPSSYLSGHSAMVMVLQSVPAAPSRGGGDAAGTHELLSADRDGWICVWDPLSGQCLRRRQLPPSCSCLGGAAALLRDGRHVALVCENPNKFVRHQAGGPRLQHTPSGFPFAHSSASRVADSLVGLVVVDAWTLAATQRLEPTYCHPVAGMQLPHTASLASFHDLPPHATAQDGGADGISRRVHMTTLRMFSGVPEELEQIAEGHRASHGVTSAEQPLRGFPVPAQVLKQQYVMSAWDATWGGMTADDVNELNQGANPDEPSHGLLRQSLGVACMVLGVTLDETVYGWQIEDTIIASTHSLEAITSTSLSGQPSPTGLFQGALGALGLPASHSEPQLPAGEHGCTGGGDSHGMAQATSFSKDGFRLLVVHERGWQLLECEAPWAAGGDIPTYSKLVASGPSPFQTESASGKTRTARLVGGVILAGPDGASRTACRPPGRPLRRHSVDAARAGAQATPTIDKLNLTGAKDAVPRSAALSGQSGGHGEGPGGAGFGGRSTLPRPSSMRLPKGDAIKPTERILLWSRAGAGIVIRVDCATGGSAPEVTLPEGDLPRPEPSLTLGAVRFQQLPGGLLLRAVTTRSEHQSYLGAEYSQQDTSLTLFGRPAAPAAPTAEPAVAPSGEARWLSAAWGGQGCMSRPNIDGVGAGTPRRRMSSPPPAGSRRRAAPAGSASAERQPLRAGGQPPAPAAHLEAVDRGRVTASALVGGDGMAPELLVHGHASGLISLFPLSAAMLPAAPMHGAGARVRPQSAAGGIDGGTPSGTPPAGGGEFEAPLPPLARPLAVLQGHLGRVLCFLEVPAHRLGGRPDRGRRLSGSGRMPGAPGSAPLLSSGATNVLLLSGGEDGSVRGWLLGDAAAGSRRAPAFVLHAHTGAVLRLMPPPPRSPRPWDNSVASVGADGTVAIISLETLQIERVLPGHPPGCPTRIVWDPTRGFMACLCQCSASIADESAPLAGLLSHSRSSSCAASDSGYESPQEGPAAATDAERLRAGVPLVKPTTPTQVKARRSSIKSKIRDSIAKGTGKLALKLQSRKEKAQGLDIKLLSPVQSQPSSGRDQPSGSHDGSGEASGGFERALAEEASASAPVASAAAPSAMLDTSCAALSAATGVSLLRIDAAQLLRDGSSAALPQAISSTATAANSSDLANLADPATIDRAGEVAALGLALGLLHQWGLDGRTDAQVLALLAAALPSRNAAVEPSQASDDPTMSGILLARGALPGLAGGVTLQLPRPVALAWERRAPPSAGGAPVAIVSAHFWGDLWRHSTEFLSGASSEAICGGASALITLYALQMQQDPSHQLALPRLSTYAALWDAPNPFLREAAHLLLHAAAGPRDDCDSAASAAGANSFRLSTEMEDVIALREAYRPRLPSAEALTTHGLSIIVAGAACLAYWDQVPEKLFRATAPLLFELACQAPAPYSSSAASLLSEGFMSFGADRWKGVIGSQLGSFVERILAVCELLSQEPSPAATASQRTGGEAAGSSERGTPARDATRGLQRAKQALRAATGSSAAISVADRSTRMACRENLTAIIPAIAAADLPLFLHILDQRLAGGVRGDSPTHMLAMISLIRLVHSRPALVAEHLPLVLSVILRGLNPANAALRRACMQGVSAAVKEFCMRFPMVAFHGSEASMLLAVGSAIPGANPHPGPAAAAAAAARPAPAAAASGSAPSKLMASFFGGASREPEPADSHDAAREMLSVYDMTTGIKKRILMLPPSNKGTPPGVGAVAFSPDGSAVLAFSPRDGCLRKWGLSERWTQRLAKGPAILAASAEQELLDPKMLPPPVNPSGQVELGYSLQCASTGHVTLSHGGVVLGQFDLSSLPSKSSPRW
eukprot:jgi/Tetstr1/442902/TSEL_030965.t1